jgi:DNA-binding NarL/FixJ family response regulator
MSPADPRRNEFAKWMDNYKAEMREVAAERLGRADGVNCENEENDVSPGAEAADVTKRGNKDRCLSAWAETMQSSVGEDTMDNCLTMSCPVCQLAKQYRLTPREVQVIALLRLTNKGIARVLRCSSKTVAKHVQHISEKTGADNKLGIGLWAVAKGMLRVSAAQQESTDTLS